MPHWLKSEYVLVLATLAAMLAAFSYALALLSQRFRTISYLTELLGEQYGFVRTKCEVLYEIRDDGSSKTSHNEAFRAGKSELGGVEHYTAIITSPKNLTQDFRVSVKSAHSEVQVIPKETLVTPTKLFYQLNFIPPLKPDRSIEYTYDVLGPPGMFLRSEEEVDARKLPYDYISMKIAYPTRRLKITIIFPPDWQIGYLDYDVWLGDSRLRVKKEYGRLDKANALSKERLDGSIVANLVVDYPVLDLKYAITWIPSPAQTTQA